MADFSGLLYVTKWSEERSDIIFSVDDENIFAHKLIVGYRSSVLKTIINASLAPKSENGEKPVIKIDDERISAKDFRTFLLFLYCNKVDVRDLEHAFTLMYLAKKYEDIHLYQFCEEYLKREINLTSVNVVTIANSASVFHDSEVFKTAIEFIATKGILMNERKYFGMNSEVLSAVLKQDKILPCSTYTTYGIGGKCDNCELAPPKEIELFDIMLKWGQNQLEMKKMTKNPKKLRKVLKSCLPFIRFPVMTVDELSTIVYPTKLLEKSVMAAVFVDSNNFAKGTTTNESTFSKVKRSFS
uniref:BTB domain-containing protein n=1 Tax=Panagrolaimus sp. JU765 TaxID=591449 RepID=A0AC34R9B2_9BILA